VDAINLTVRSDNIGMLRCYAFLPDQAFEVARLQVATNLLRSVVDLFARVIDYYPSKPIGSQPKR
jgi:hypothetical protein